VFPGLLGVVLSSLSVAAAEETVKPGDKVKVISGPAPVKVGRKTLTTVETGTELTALKVHGRWVKVTVEEGGKQIKGWIHTKRLKLVEPPRARRKRKPKGPGGVWLVENATLKIVGGFYSGPFGLPGDTLTIAPKGNGRLVSVHVRLTAVVPDPRARQKLEEKLGSDSIKKLAGKYRMFDMSRLALIDPGGKRYAADWNLRPGAGITVFKDPRSNIQFHGQGQQGPWKAHLQKEPQFWHATYRDDAGLHVGLVEVGHPTDAAFLFSVPSDVRLDTLTLQLEDGEPVPLKKAPRGDAAVRAKGGPSSPARTDEDYAPREMVLLRELSEVAKRPLSRSDITGLLAAWRDVVAASGVSSARLKEPLAGGNLRLLEDDPAIAAAVAKHGMTVRTFVYRLVIARGVAAVMDAGGIEKAEAELADYERKSGAMDPEARKLLALMRGAVKLLRATPPATREAVKPFVEKLRTLGEKLN